MFWSDQLRRLWRSPDKPMRVYPAFLGGLEKKGGFIAEAKYDGFRGVITIDSKEIRSYSRHFERLPVSEKLLDSLRSLNFPDGSALDVEWMDRRSGLTEAIYLLDVLYFGWQWQGGKPLSERLVLFDGLALPEATHRPETRTADFLDFFEAQVGDPNTTITEGLVLKNLNSKLIGKPSVSANNPLWYKVKWRDGPNGRQVVYRCRQKN